MSYNVTVVANILSEQMNGVLDNIDDVLFEIESDCGEEGVREMVGEWNECLKFINETLNVNRPLINAEDYIDQ